MRCWPPGGCALDRSSRRPLVVGALWVCVALALPAAELRGRVELVAGDSRRPPRGVELGNSVVAFVPDAPVAPTAASESFEMATVRKSFEPEILVVPVGSTVVFPNFDPILHNVFSVTPGNAFDVGVYGRGEGKSARFTGPGVVRVFCNVHQSMYGHILVVDTQYFQIVEADGSFHLSGLPDGPGRLLTWHPQGELTSRRVETDRQPLVVEVETDRRRVPRHLNKFGKPYRSRRNRYSG